MDHTNPPRSASRSTLGEALIVVSVVLGFFAPFMRSDEGFPDIWSFAAFLGVIAVFYMALLFCRMLFFWMTGGDQTPYPWWTHAEMAKKMKQ